jgi:hypothetical protein
MFITQNIFFPIYTCLTGRKGHLYQYHLVVKATLLPEDMFAGAFMYSFLKVKTQNAQLDA